MGERYGFGTSKELAEVPEHMVELLEYFEATMVLEISQVFDSPVDYWEAQAGYRARNINGGSYDHRMDILSELRQQRLDTEKSSQ